MTVEAFAKVNLTLEVFAERDDGYHELKSVVMPVSLSDALEIGEAPSFSSDTGYDDDLCLKAARVLDPTRGVRVKVKKRIPAGGGLGGGSADAAAVLRALNEMRGLGLSRAQLAEIGAGVGSDVPSLVLGGAVLMEGRGERVTPIVLPDGFCLHLVLVNPRIESSTAAVYAEVRDGRRLTAEDAACSPTRRMIAALQANDFDGIVSALSNDLQRPAIRLYPEIAGAIDSLRAAGAAGVSMSGSGSCVFGLVRDADEATELSSRMNARGYQSWPVRTGAENMV